MPSKESICLRLGSLSPQDKYISVQKWVQTIKKENKISRREYYECEGIRIYWEISRILS